MPAKIPDMKFDKDQTPWARWAQNEITALTQRLAAKDASDSNINQGSSATLALLGGQIQALADAEGVLATTETTLAATVADLATAQAAITDLLAVVIVPQVQNGGSTSYTLTTTFSVNVVTLNFTVPTGYTRALITTTGSVVTGSSASGDVGIVRCAINGVGGPQSECPFLPSSIAPNIPASYSASLSGLSAGDTIPINIQARLNTGPWAATAASASLSATVMFLP